jgi:type IV pilus assembly protein PilO
MALTWDDIKKMPPLRKALLVALIYILVGYLYFSFLLQAGFEKRAKLSDRLSTLQQQISEKAQLAAQLPQYVRDIAKLKKAFQLALIKLPEKKEIPELLHSIALEGKRIGLDFILFEPVVEPATTKEPEQKQAKQKQQNAPAPAPISKETTKPEKFYEEVLAKTTIKGSFHKTVLFFEKMAKLPRIINVEDLSMEGNKEGKNSGKKRAVNTTFILKTYVFVKRGDEKSE